MNCEQILDRLQQVFNESRSVSLPSDVKRHLRGCRRCRETAAGLASIHAALADLAPHPGDELPERFHDRFLKRLAGEAPHGRRAPSPGRERSRSRSPHRVPGRGRILPAVFLTAAAAAAVVLGLLLPRAGEIAPPGQTQSPAAAVRPAPAAPSLLVAGTEKFPPAEAAGMLAGLSSVELELEDAVPTPRRVYASVGAEVSDLTLSFYEATTLLTRSLSGSASEF